MSAQSSLNSFGWCDALPTSAHSYLLPSILAVLPSGRLRIIDIGSGNGYMAGQLHRAGHQIIGVEPSTDGFRIAAEKYPDVRFICRSVYDESGWGELEGWANVVLAAEVIEHLYYPRACFDRAYKLLKPGGTLIVTTPYHGYLKNLALSVTGKWDNHFKVWWDGGHIKFFSRKTLARMIADTGFTRPHFEYSGRFPFFWKSMIGIAAK